MNFDRDEDCNKKVCVGADELLKKGMQMYNKKNGERLADSETPSTSSRQECPVDKDELGRNSWSLLHTISVYYPEKPEEKDKEAARQLLSSLSHLYPCDYCAADLRDELQKCPPTLGSREEFAGWMCALHNKVNEKTGKKKFDCARVFERWRDGPPDGRCD